MPLSSGDRLGPYEIIAPLGAGGMGEVYRARDTRLDREVAIKVLPAAVAQNSERLIRFEREAKVLASLNHPNIATIHGVEDAGGVHALVMELVPGRPLQGPLPLATALDYARQIAAALEAAHDKGIVHRDLKPANIMVTPEGVVKVLDFGLAAVTPGSAPESSDPANSPTLTRSATRAGMIMGTAAYMSPEQASGKPVDKRADIWAFGVVLFEMLTGKPLFGGETISHTLADVLRAPIDLSRLPTETPWAIRDLLRRCLNREVKKRMRDIGEARIAIEDVPAGPVAAEPEARRQLLPWAVSAGLLATLAGVSLFHIRQHPPDSPLMQFSIPPPEKVSYIHLAPSPDGRLLAFSAESRGFALWLRRLDSLTSQLLEGSEGALLPFWSPDSRFLGFFADGKLKRIDVAAASGPGRLRTLCDSPGTGGATWNRDGVIVFGGGPGQALYRTTASGGEATALTRLDPSRQEKTHFWPWFLPDGRHFLYTVVSNTRENSGVYVGNLDTPERKRLLGDLTNAVYVTTPAQQGLLLFVRGRILMAQRFAAAALRLSAEPFALAERLNYDALWARAEYSVSQNGVLAYLGSGGQSQLTWFDRTGKRIGTVGDPGTHEGGFDLSPDDKRVAVARLDPNTGTSDIWLMELGRGVSSRLTFDPGDDVAPVWSPDGERLVFSSNRGGTFDLYQKDANGGGREELLLKTGLAKFAGDWSRDGRFLLYGETDLAMGWLWTLPLFGDRKPAPLQRARYGEYAGAFSPDSKWVAYQSEESGKFQIYVSGFGGTEAAASPGAADRTGRKWPVSNGGGWYPYWRRDGSELYYVDLEYRLMAVGVNTNPTFQPGVPRLLFVPPSLDSRAYLFSPFAVSGDGQRFLTLSRVEANSPPATVVLNWTKGLKP